MSALDYPPPSYAGYIWHRGDSLVLGLPGGENTVGHTIVLPLAKLVVSRDADQRGWLVLLEILGARKRTYEEGRRPQLATSDTPLRTQIEALLAGHRARAFDSRGREKVGDIFAKEEDE